MRLLFISNLYPPHALGGYEMLCRDVAEALAARGHEVRVLTSDAIIDGALDADALADTDATGPVRVERTLRLYPRWGGPVRTRLTGRIAHTAHNARIAEAAFAAWRPDVVFAWCQNRLSLGPVYAAQDLGLPVAYSFNDEHFRQFAPTPRAGVKSRLRRVAEAALPALTHRRLDLRRATAISAALRDKLAGHGLPERDIRLIHQGIPLDRFPLREAPARIGEPARVLYAGQLHPDKGVDIAIRAVGRLRQAGRAVRLSIVGAGDHEPALRDLALVVAPGGVDFHGRVPRAQMPAVYRAHDLFIFPSVWAEPFGLTHLEAMASGLPVVSTTVGGCAEFLRDGDNALTVRAGDADDTADALGRLLDSASLRATLVRGGRATVEDRLNTTRYVDDLESLLREAASAGSPVRTGITPVPGNPLLRLVRRALLRRRLAGIGAGATIDRRCRVFHPERVRIGAGSTLAADAYVIGNSSAAPVAVDLGARVDIVPGAYLAATDGTIRIGDDTRIGPGTVLYGNGRLTIGRGVTIGARVGISTVNHRSDRIDVPIREQGLECRPITIGDGATIGDGSVIVSGVTIGAGAVVAPGSVVSRDVAPNTCVAGVPARPVTVPTSSIPVAASA
jgi:glycogen(starch) synthase